MSRLIAVLIRHGDYHQLDSTPSAHQPFALNKEGENQAHAGVSKLQDMAAAHNWVFNPEIDCSNLLRAWQTAEILRKNIPGLETTCGYDDLAERGVGSAANLTLTEIEEILAFDPRFETPPKDWKSNSHYRLPLQGAESLMDAGNRVAEHIQKTMMHLGWKDGLNIAKIFVGHGAAFRHSAHHLGVLEFDDIAKLSMYHADPVCLEWHADGHWTHCAGNWKVRKKMDLYLD